MAKSGALAREETTRDKVPLAWPLWEAHASHDFHRLSDLVCHAEGSVLALALYTGTGASHGCSAAQHG